MKAIIISLLQSGGMQVLMCAAGALLSALVGGILACIPKVLKYLETLIQSYASDKVRTRLTDAFAKLDHITEIVIASDKAMADEKIKAALADGKITREELTDLVKSLADNTLKLIKPELDTLKSYFVGDEIVSYITSYITNKIMAKVSGVTPNTNTISPFPVSNPQVPVAVAETDKAGDILADSPAV